VKPRECRARVDASRHLAPAILEVDLRMEEPPALEFDAGQWVSVPFGPKTVRAYSIASTPQSPKVLTLCADVAPGGLGSAWFRALTPGDEVRFKGPTRGAPSSSPKRSASCRSARS
jgi:ferredoxin-NADP reductase